jgi:acyl-CoA oxidase
VAVYQPSSQTFTINSPTISSAKFWPGVLGQYATHSVIQARTIVEGKDIGVQTFVIELRDAQLQTLPNVEAYDIGQKLGFERVDNGALLFHNLTIPRRALLMRYVRVTAEGKVEGAENKQAIKYGYGSMLNLRVKLTYNFALRGIVTPVVALHSLLQAEGTAALPANRKLVTDHLCVGLGFTLANKHPHIIFNQLLKEIEAKNYSKADKLLVTCHIISSTFKALSSN